jgi:hypothetical protein
VISALLALALAAAPSTSASAHVEDDWPRALALAKERDAPILVDVWAPW